MNIRRTSWAYKGLSNIFNSVLTSSLKWKIFCRH